MDLNFYRTSLTFFISILVFQLFGQTASIQGTILDENDQPISFATIAINNSTLGTESSDEGTFHFKGLKSGSYTLIVSYLGYKSNTLNLELADNEQFSTIIRIEPSSNKLDEIVVTGTLKEVNRLESPVPVEVYNPKFFKKNPTTNIYEALQNINGVRPQLNCQVCNTGDIHINGLEGPYTMVLIDGMPIVSSLATVYGLTGIPNSLIERVEIVKGPASSLYGSEAIGGLINVITKNANKAPIVSADIMSTSWEEHNVDLGLKLQAGNAASVLTGINYFNYQNPVDNNSDNFTDVSLQERVSVFQKWQFNRKDNKLFSIAGRYYWEDRWGGELQWTPEFRGGSEIYGEAITTKRFEIISQYELPVKEKMMLSLSYNDHHQNSVYGDTPYIGDQRIAFGQLTWNKEIKKHDILMGLALRYTWYDDNTPATGGESKEITNSPDEIWLPGIFIQDEIKLTDKHKLLLGLRYDYNDDHGSIVTPRFAYKWSASLTDIFRINAGTGFRVVNLFTEDHAALTGAREVVIVEELNPEQSYNVNANYTKKFYMENGSSASIELTSFYTYFTNVILPDYDFNPNQIIYDNLEGSAVSKGISMNSDLQLSNGLSIMIGGTLMDVSTEEEGISERQILTERFTGTWSISYPFFNGKLAVDYTGNLYGPMRLPLLGDLDPRPEESPWWSIQNIQLTYKGMGELELYGGVKNLLNWTPWRGQDEPIIARAFDPFDRQVQFDASGAAVPTADNPNALTFDPSYVYGPNQGLRVFMGIRYAIK